MGYSMRSHVEVIYIYKNKKKMVTRRSIRFPPPLHHRSSSGRRFKLDEYIPDKNDKYVIVYKES